MSEVKKLLITGVHSLLGKGFLNKLKTPLAGCLDAVSKLTTWVYYFIVRWLSTLFFLPFFNICLSQFEH